MLSVTYTDQGTVATLQRLLTETRRPATILQAIADEAQNQYRAHFERKQQQAPKMPGAQPRNLWRQIAQSLQPAVIDPASGRVSLAVSHPAFAQKVFGGAIRAQRARSLSIPLAAEAYGRAPAEFESATGQKLFLLRARGNSFLATMISRAQGLKIEYVLKPSVTQPADPTALPDENVISAALTTRAQEALNAIE